MRLFCFGDIGIRGDMPQKSPWPFPFPNSNAEKDTYILFNWELPSSEQSLKIPRANGSGYRFVSPPGAAVLVSHWGPTVAALANNHLMDGGTEGVRNTMKELESFGLTYFGGGMTFDAAARPWIWETEEGRLGVINWVTAETHPDPPDQSGMGPNLWPGDEEAKAQIARLRQEVDWVVIYLHWSDELFPYPRPIDRQMAERLVTYGADAVVGNHSHVVRGMETIQGKPVFYSLGNCFFSPDHERVRGQSHRLRESIAVELKFSRGKTMTWNVHSFWKNGRFPSLDSRQRAVRQMKKVSRPLSFSDYGNWYCRTRKSFDRWGYRWHFQIPALGWRGVLGWVLKKAQSNIEPVLGR
ncbi:CapA family protein [Candidatus Nitronereus thalassa]|uniref:CapA family protein n=1 Tax=Candidatus Nitronereus thalassa TaxID=3020898 RepID=A0ABU3K578_9BACT|nr:CapA family protein [Candidatus Nitronereus thalassa]MDT7041564.1 CapA family protein [Candidatus Nitronereus thalassa]